jgi:hypothetical protein
MKISLPDPLVWQNTSLTPPHTATTFGPRVSPVAVDYRAGMEGCPGPSHGQRTAAIGSQPVADLLLSKAEIERLTSYARPGDQLAELRRQGFHRARRNRLGEVVLERAHYDAVCTRGCNASDAEDDRPRPKLRPVQR